MTNPPIDQHLVAAAIAHRGCCGSEHDPKQGKLHGFCVVCGVPWPCDTAKAFMVPALAESIMGHDAPDLSTEERARAETAETLLEVHRAINREVRGMLGIEEGQSIPSAIILLQTNMKTARAELTYMMTQKGNSERGAEAWSRIARAAEKRTEEAEEAASTLQDELESANDRASEFIAQFHTEQDSKMQQLERAERAEKLAGTLQTELTALRVAHEEAVKAVSFMQEKVERLNLECTTVANLAEKRKGTLLEVQQHLSDMTYRNEANRKYMETWRDQANVTNAEISQAKDRIKRYFVAAKFNDIENLMTAFWNDDNAPEELGTVIESAVAEIKKDRDGMADDVAAMKGELAGARAEVERLTTKLADQFEEWRRDQNGLAEAMIRLGAIDAAMDGNPPMPEILAMEHSFDYITRLKEWGTQNRDAAAALRVEAKERANAYSRQINELKTAHASTTDNLWAALNEARERADQYSAEVKRLNGDLAAATARLAAIEAAKKEAIKVPDPWPSENSISISKVEEIHSYACWMRDAACALSTEKDRLIERIKTLESTNRDLRDDLNNSKVAPWTLMPGEPMRPGVITEWIKYSQRIRAMLIAERVAHSNYQQTVTGVVKEIADWWAGEDGEPFTVEMLGRLNALR